MVETRWQRLERWTGKRSADLDTEELARARLGGYEPGPDGCMVGRDPRRISPAELKAMGHQQMSAFDAVRRKCLDCCADSSHEVRLCVAITCPSWPFRMGKSPWRAKPSEERLVAMRESGRRLVDKIKSSAAEPDKTRASDEEEVEDESGNRKCFTAINRQ
jgi:hypothetical protein